MTGEDATVHAVIELRRRNERVDENMALELISSKINGRGTGTDGHAVPWAADAWLRQAVWQPEAWDKLDGTPTDDHISGSGVWSPEAHRLLGRLASSLPTADRPGVRMISRADVFERRERDPLELFLAAMAWGHGSNGYGWSRTAAILAAAQRSAVPS